MLVNCLYPTLGNIEILSREDSLEDIENKYTTAFSGTYLIPRTFFFGRFLTIIKEPFEEISSRPDLQTALETALVALEQFREYLLQPVENPENWIETFLSFSYNDTWPRIFAKTYQLFNPNSRFPSMDVALQLLSPKILHQLASVPVPFEALDNLLVDQRPDMRYRRGLDRWVAEVNRLGQTVSPKLLFSFVQYIVNRRFVGMEGREQLMLTFQLASRLHQIGLVAFVQSQPVLIQPDSEVSGDIEGLGVIKAGERLHLAFPLDFSLQAFEFKGRPGSMIIHSSSPLALGMWAYEAFRKNSYVPLLKVEHMDDQARFFVTERIAGWLEDPELWDRTEFLCEKNLRICASIARCIESLTLIRQTLDVTPAHLFMTCGWEVGTMRAFSKKHDYFHVPTIEGLIRTICFENRERIRAVMVLAKLFEHPHVVALREIVRIHRFQATEKHISEIVCREQGCEAYFSEICAWHEALQNRVRFALTSLKQNSAFSKISSIQHMRLLSEAFMVLQEREGFLMHLPPELFVDMVELVLSANKKR